MLSLNVRTPVHENNHTSHRVQDPSLIRISQQGDLRRNPPSSVLGSTFPYRISGEPLPCVKEGVRIPNKDSTAPASLVRHLNTVAILETY